METLWFAALLSAICLEGLARKYIPGMPPAAMYFLKDVILLYGWLRFRPAASVQRTASYLYRGFGLVMAASMVWTVVELVNPDQESFLLGLIGLRSYWLWWLAPPVIANVVRSPKVKRRAIYVLAVMALGVSALAATQFAAPADSRWNLYSVKDGEDVYAADVATVASTGKARVSGTFTFLSGFADFTLTIPALLLSLGLEEGERRTRRLAFAGGLAVAATLPMAGSRSSVVYGIVILFLMVWTAGLLFTRVGRRIFVAGGLALVAAGFAFPEAILGVQSRFGDAEETTGRFADLATFLPPVALVSLDYPAIGIGTGMVQNVRFSFNIKSQLSPESEVGRYLVELGPVGFLLVWTAKLGLMVGLLRASSILKRAGKRGSAGMALSYAAVTMTGNLAFDHNWQALYFMGCGFILAEVTRAMEKRPQVAVQTDVSPVAIPSGETPLAI